MRAHREILRALAGQRVAQIDPRHLAGLFAAAQEPGELVPTGEESAAEEPEVESGILVYRVRGTIVHHATDAFDAAGMVSPSEWLTDAIRRAASDTAIRGVVLDIDSGGGMAAGTPEAADAVYRFRQESGKPIWAVANGSAYSAAYYIGAAAGRFLVTPSGGVGSVGTLAMHQDITAFLEQIGVKIEILRATDAENKARFNPFESLTDEEREVAIRDLDTINRKFLADVGRFRGLDPDRVAEVSELGRTFLALEAVERGLADGVATLDEAVAELATLFAPVPRHVAQEATEIRAMGPEQGIEVRASETRRVEGTAVPYGSLSVNLGGFREEFLPGAFAGSLEDDIHVLWMHDNAKVLGRRGAGTAGIHDSPDRLEYWAIPPKTTWAEDALESIRRGDVTGSSFRFLVLGGGQTWDRRDGVDIRVISKARLIECSPVSFPAYPATDVRVAQTEHRRWVALGRPQGWRGTDRRSPEDFAREARERGIEIRVAASRAQLREETRRLQREMIPGTDEHYRARARERGTELERARKRADAQERADAGRAGTPAWYRRRAAFHEAGHAVAGYLEGLTFYGFSIEHGRPGMGHAYRKGSEPTPRYLASGIAAEKLALAFGNLVGPADPYSGSAQDFEKIRAALGGRGVTDAQVRTTVAEAESLLRPRWRAVVAVADALLALPPGAELGGERAVEIIIAATVREVSA